MGKQRLRLVLTALCLLLSAAFVMSLSRVPSVNASPAIYIRENGAVEPASAPISTADNITYTFTDNILDSIVIERDGVTLDGAGYTLQGTGTVDSKGIDLTQRSTVTIRNVKIKNFAYGIYLYYSPNNDVSSNSIQNNEYGIYLFLSSHNSLQSNNVTSNSVYGIYLDTSSNNMLTSNLMVDNLYNFGISGGHSLSQYVNQVDASNTVDGKPIYYWINEHDRTVPTDAGFLALINCTRMRVENLSIAKNRGGILLAFTKNSTITGNDVKNNLYGMHLESSPNNVIYQNNLTTNSDWGIDLYLSMNNRIVANNITANGYRGVDLQFSSYNVISRNHIAKNSPGVYLYSSTSNKIVANNITGNSGYGINSLFSSNNEIFHNNFNNTAQAYSYESINSWDDGYPSGGNYWSDYTGVDEKSGPDQNQPGSDGIGDTAYVPSSNSTDHYPLMTIWTAKPPVTSNDYDGSWHNHDIIVNLTATDYDYAGMAETYYRINDGSVKNVSTDGQPLITTEGGNNTLECWSIDYSGEKEFPHKIFAYIKLDKTPPIANAGEDQTVNAGSLVSFNASSSTDNIGIVSYEWNFGDGTTTTGETATHTYTSGGTYSVTLTVKDAAGNVATKTITVTVMGPPGLPIEAYLPWIVAGAAAAVIASAALLVWRRRRKRS